MGQGEPADGAGAVPGPARARARLARRAAGAVHPGPLRRRRPGAPHPRAAGDHQRLARAVRAQHVHPPAGGGAGRLPAGLHHPARAGVRGRSGPRRLPLEHLHRALLRGEDDPDLRHLLRRRDQEEHLHRDELAVAGARRAADALLRQPRQERRHRAVLRPVGHRQDHALLRPRAQPDRRRRARLVGQRRLQLRGRLLRQGDPPEPRGGAADLERLPPLRRGAGERGGGRARAARPRRRAFHREHPLLLPAGVHPEHGAGRAGAGAEERGDADRRRLRRAAADRQALAGAGDVPLPVRLHGARGRHGEGPRQGAAGDLLHLLRRPVPAAPPGSVRPDAGGAHRRSTAPIAGW